MYARICNGNCDNGFHTPISLETVTDEWNDNDKGNMTCLIRYECLERRGKLLLEFVVEMGHEKLRKPARKSSQRKMCEAWGRTHSCASCCSDVDNLRLSANLTGLYTFCVLS